MNAPDHKAAALRLLEESYSAPAESLEQAGRDAIAAALVHSNLAIAEGQERVAEELKAIRESFAGDGLVAAVQPAIDAFVSAADQIPEIIWRNTGGGK